MFIQIYTVFFLFINFNLVQSVKYEEIVDLHHIDITYLNEEYISYLNITVQPLTNERNADKSVSFEYEIIKPLENPKVYALLYQYLNNEYKPSFVEFKGSICDLMKHPFIVNFFLSKMTKSSKIPTCPIEPGVYWVRNFVGDQKLIGAASHQGMNKGMFKIHFTLNKVDIIKLEIYLEKKKRRVKE